MTVSKLHCAGDKATLEREQGLQGERVRRGQEMFSKCPEVCSLYQSEGAGGSAVNSSP